MKYKPQVISHMREIINTKQWSPHCVVVKQKGKLPENISCIKDREVSRTCLMCAVTEARNALQEKFLEGKKEETDDWVFPLYGFVYPVLMRIGRQLAGNVRNLTKEQAFEACSLFEKDPVSF